MTTSPDKSMSSWLLIQSVILFQIENNMNKVKVGPLMIVSIFLQSSALKNHIYFHPLSNLQNITQLFRKYSIMTEQMRQLKMSHQELTNIFDSLLKIPRSHKILHPSQERTKYSEILDWFTKVASQLLRVKDISSKTLSEKQQQIIVSCLEQLILLARKECAQKSLLLQMILEYLVGTLKAYWKALQNANRQVWYQFQHNSVRVEREYISELKRMQMQNDELKKDKEHRWRNMFMLIKDNRIHRRQNKKLIVSINHEMDKNVSLAQQMILLRQENEKLKIKLATFQNDTIRIEGYVQTQIKLLELQKSIRDYPKRSKKILKNDLLKIQIQQINNLNDRIKFIIKAIEQTGEIIDQFYDEETVFPNFQYNISTQTELSTEEKSTNTPIIRMVNVQTSLFAPDLTQFQIQQSFNLNIKARNQKNDRKQVKERQTRNGMMIPFNSSSRLLFRREDDKTKEVNYRKLMDSPFSICESVKMTIYKGRISYISTYNTEIFNGLQIIKKIEQKMQIQKKDTLTKELITKDLPQKKQLIEIEIQTDPQEVIVNRTIVKAGTKMSHTLPQFFNSQQCFDVKRKKTHISSINLRIYSLVNYQYNPIRSVVHPKLKLAHQAKEQTPKNSPSDKVVQSNRSLFRKHRRINSSQLSFPPSLQDSLASKKDVDKRQTNDERKFQQFKNDCWTQTEQKFHIRMHMNSSRTSLDGKEQVNLQTKQTNSINSSFLNSVDIKKIKPTNNKFFQQTYNTLASAKVKTLQKNSDISPIKEIQQKKLSKTSKAAKDEMLKHKRTNTDTNENEKNVQIPKIQYKIKAKPLHRISEVLTEGMVDLVKEQFSAAKDKNALHLTMTKQGEIKSMDFSKGVQKILRNMQIRRNQILSNNYTLKTYLSSYFKCLYGKQIYQSFIAFLAKCQPQQQMVCFSRLSNSKCPEPYLIDIFKVLVKSIGKCYLVGQSPCSSKLRYEVLKYLLSLFMEQDQINTFSLMMRNKGCYTLMGWFNSVESQIRKYAIQSQLYSVLCRWVHQTTHNINYEFIQQITYFMQNNIQTSKSLIKAKYLLSDSIPIHRLCLFAYRFQWNSILNLESSIMLEYQKRLSQFDQQQSLFRIRSSQVILKQFKHLNKCFKQWSFLNQKYGTIIDSSLLMIIELNIQEYRLKNQLPLSKDLKYLSLAFEGLQKKRQLQCIREKVEHGYVFDSRS